MCPVGESSSPHGLEGLLGVWSDEVGKAKRIIIVTEDSQCSQRLGFSTRWYYSIIILPFFHVKKSKTFINGPSGQHVITGGADRIQAKTRDLTS